MIGDFNAPMNAPELAPLFTTLYDTWTKVRHEPGLTSPADHPDRKIDAILVTAGIRTRSADIIPSVASDHRPIVAEVTIHNQNRGENLMEG